MISLPIQNQFKLSSKSIGGVKFFLIIPSRKLIHIDCIYVCVQFYIILCKWESEYCLSIRTLTMQNPPALTFICCKRNMFSLRNKKSSILSHLIILRVVGHRLSYHVLHFCISVKFIFLCFICDENRKTKKLQFGTNSKIITS